MPMIAGPPTGAPAAHGEDSAQSTIVTYSVNWGAGTTQAPDTQTLDGVGAALPQNSAHKYAAAGTYTALDEPRRDR